MNNSIRRNAAKVLAISLLLITGAASAQTTVKTTRNEKQLQSDRSALGAGEQKLKSDQQTL